MTSRSDKPRQLPLALGHGDARTRDDMMVSAANQEAVGLVEQWPDWPAPVVALVGPKGSGRSHLASVWQQVSGATRLDPSDIAESASALGSRPVLLIEDIDRAQIDQTGLFHLINGVRSQAGHLLLTAATLPTQWPVALPDLRSRLAAASVVRIGEPDEPLLSGVIAKLFADRQVEVEPHVIQFIIRRIDRSLASAARVVDVLDRAAIETKRPITRALAADILSRETGQT